MVTLVERPIYDSAALKELGARVRQGRKELRLSRVEVGRDIGISASYVGHIENGMRRPDTPVLQELARVLRLDYDELAILAHYAAPRAGDQAVYAPSSTASRLRRLLRFPDSVLDRLDRIGDMIFYEDNPGGQNADVESREERDKDSGPDEPDADTAAQRE